jgi:tetratricopeptide (TPR) repeat protein
MTCRRQCRFALPALTMAVAALLSFRVHGASSREPSPGWEALARLQAREAGEAFAELPGDREARLGRAATLLALQPRTPANITRSESVLLQVVAEDADDETGVAAAYLLARIAQLHATPSQPERALERFRELRSRHPNHPLAQTGVVKSAVIILYSPGARASLPARFADVEGMADAIHDDAIRFEFHQVLREAYGRLLGDHEGQLRHARRQLQLPAPRTVRRADVLIHAAESCRRLDRPAEALPLLNQFLAEFPRESRAGEVAAVRATLLESR